MVVYWVDLLVVRTDYLMGALLVDSLVLSLVVLTADLKAY